MELERITATDVIRRALSPNLLNEHIKQRQTTISDMLSTREEPQWGIDQHFINVGQLIQKNANRLLNEQH